MPSPILVSTAETVECGILRHSAISAPVILRIKHLRTRPYRPRTNGKAERFIRTMLAGWAYAAIYANSHERQHALPGWLYFYNHE